MLNILPVTEKMQRDQNGEMHTHDKVQKVKVHFEHDHSEIKLGRVHYEINLVTWRYEPYIKNSRNDIGTGH